MTEADSPTTRGQVHWEALFSETYPSLFRYVHRLTGDEDQAEDVAQECFVRLLRRPLPADREAKLWLFSVALNLVRDAGRKHARRKRLLTMYSPPATAADRPDEVTEQRETAAHVRAALARLPERDRAMLLMRQEGFTHREIAETAGVAHGSVGTLLARSMKRLRAALHDTTKRTDDEAS